MANSRLERMRENMSACGIDDFYCRDISNVQWLTEFEGVFDDEPAHLAFVTPKKAFVHTDSRYADACDRASRHTPWVIDACGGAHAAWVAKKFAAFHAAAGTPEGENVCAMGIEDSIELREFRELERAFSEAKWKPRFAETDGFVKKMRAVKDERELSAMRAAQAITDA
ncbi:MAG: aminopeptidase P family N-terminal domain-containing protein, partial [Slackia isoflavoniconvertens]|nr:aminopeptidase P family N-terminal domain-containing protein [Slackia isoflavoniconvertens]